MAGSGLTGANGVIEAFAWIAEALDSRSIPFRVAGGLAARLYGAVRPLADIDLDVPEEHLATIGTELKAFIMFGPERFVDEYWDLQLLSLDYHGQKIDLSGAHDARVFDHNRKKWIRLSTHFESSPRLEVLNRSALVIPKRELITYKRMLCREVDQIDVEQMTRVGGG